jgi:hypothetical protein
MPQAESEARYHDYVSRLPLLNRSIHDARWRRRVLQRAGTGLAAAAPQAAEGGARRRCCGRVRKVQRSQSVGLGAPLPAALQTAALLEPGP